MLRKVQCRFLSKVQMQSGLAWSDICAANTHLRWWSGKPGAPQESWGRLCCTCLMSLQFKKRKKGWRLSSESCLVRLEAPLKCHFVSCVSCFSFRGSASCCLDAVLKTWAFIAVVEMSHFPDWGRLHKMGLSTAKREFTGMSSCWWERAGVRLSEHLGGKKLWLKNLSLTGCEMKNHKHFLCQTLKHVEALLMHRSPMTVTQQIFAR